MLLTGGDSNAAAYVTKEQHLRSDERREVWSHQLISSDAGIAHTA